MSQYQTFTTRSSWPKDETINEMLVCMFWQPCDIRLYFFFCLKCRVQVIRTDMWSINGDIIVISDQTISQNMIWPTNIHSKVVASKGCSVIGGRQFICQFQEQQSLDLDAGRRRKSMQMPTEPTGNEATGFMLCQPLSCVSRNFCHGEDSTFLRAAYLSVAACHRGTPQEFHESRLQIRRLQEDTFLCLVHEKVQLNSMSFSQTVLRD